MVLPSSGSCGVWERFDWPNARAKATPMAMPKPIPTPMLLIATPSEIPIATPRAMPMPQLEESPHHARLSFVARPAR